MSSHCCRWECKISELLLKCNKSKESHLRLVICVCKFERHDKWNLSTKLKSRYIDSYAFSCISQNFSIKQILLLSVYSPSVQSPSDLFIHSFVHSIQHILKNEFRWTVSSHAQLCCRFSLSLSPFFFLNPFPSAYAIVTVFYPLVKHVCLCWNTTME